MNLTQESMYAVPSHCPAPLSSLSSRRRRLQSCLVAWSLSAMCVREHTMHMCVSMKVHGMYGYVPFIETHVRIHTFHVPSSKHMYVSIHSM